VREHQTRARAISLRLCAEAEQRTVNAESRLTAATLAINRQRHRWVMDGMEQAIQATRGLADLSEALVFYGR
jgi:hypothetical protein